mgnify:CR=1 FL=1
MLCFRGMAFCLSGGKTCANTECTRYFKESDREEATEWMGENATIFWSEFSDRCGQFIKKESNNALFSQEG